MAWDARPPSHTPSFMSLCRSPGSRQFNDLRSGTTSVRGRGRFRGSSGGRKRATELGLRSKAMAVGDRDVKLGVSVEPEG